MPLLVDHSVELCMQVILPVVIFAFGPISGAHFNPMITTVMVLTGLLVSSGFCNSPSRVPCELVGGYGDWVAGSW